MHDVAVYAVVLLPFIGWLAWAGGNSSSMNFYEREIHRAMRRQSRKVQRYRRSDSVRQMLRRLCCVLRR